MVWLWVGILVFCSLMHLSARKAILIVKVGWCAVGRGISLFVIIFTDAEQHYSL